MSDDRNDIWHLYILTDATQGDVLTINKNESVANLFKQFRAKRQVFREEKRLSFLLSEGTELQENDRRRLVDVSCLRDKSNIRLIIHKDYDGWPTEMEATQRMRNPTVPSFVKRFKEHHPDIMGLYDDTPLAKMLCGHATDYPKDKAALDALKTFLVSLEKMKTENQLDELDRLIFCFLCDLMLHPISMQILFASTHEPEPTSTVTRAQNKVASSPEENAVTSYSDPNCEDNTASLEDSVKPNRNKQKVLRPLPGFIELTTEPDMITFDDDPKTKRAKMPCGHVIGPDSMTDYFRDILNSGRFKFKCPSSKCSCEWEYFLVRHVACLSDEEMQQFEKELEHNFLQKEQGNQMCPRCKTWCVKAPGAGNRVRCPICTANRGKKFEFCWVCLKEWNRFLSSGPCGNPGCDGKDKRINILASCPTKKINLCFGCPSIRGCPKCGLLIEHQDQCGHVSCSNCHYKFCFICLTVCKDGESHCSFIGTCKLAPRQVSLPGSR